MMMMMMSACSTAITRRVTVGAFQSTSMRRHHVLRSAIASHSSNVDSIAASRNSLYCIHTASFSSLHSTKCSTVLKKDVRLSSARYATAADSQEDMDTNTSIQLQLKGFDWIRQNIASVLNDTFDSKEVARAIALAKLEPKKKKKKKKKKPNNDAGDGEQQQQEKPVSEGPPPLTQEEKDAIANKAAEEALPFTLMDTMVTPATKLEFGDYQCNAAMGLAKHVGMSPRDCANKIVEKLRPAIEGIMEEPEIAGPGFINLRFKKEYLEQCIYSMAQDPIRLSIPTSA